MSTPPPVGHITKVFAVQDCKISPLTADPATGSPTYGTAIDVPGIQTVAISGDMDTKTLTGDNKTLDSVSTLTGVTVKIENAKISLDVLAALFGGEVTDDTTGDTAIASWDLLGSSTPQYFKLECKTPSNGADPVGGDVHFVLHKVSLSAFPDLGNANEDYATTGFSGAALPLLSNDKWISVVINATATTIAA